MLAPWADSMAPCHASCGSVCFRVLAATLALSFVASCSAKGYWEYDSEFSHRQPLAKRCGEFECPAFKRPVQKSEDDFRVWAWTKCPVEGKVPEQLDEDAKRRRKAQEKDLDICCQVKYVCLNTCGMQLGDCYKLHWECVERECYRSWRNDSQECLSMGAWNDMSHLPHAETGEIDYWGFRGEEACQAFNAFQRQACDCVPQPEWDKLLQTRMEAFFKKHDPSLLTKKGKIKDKELWKRWRGKRPQMMFAFTMKHRKDTVDLHKNTSREEEEEEEEAAQTHEATEEPAAESGSTSKVDEL